jgi:hypothetical protein
MTTKLTLTVEKEVIEMAKIYARKNGRSLSDLIENYLKALVQKQELENELSPMTKKLLGSVKAPKNFNYKKEIETILKDKYSK